MGFIYLLELAFLQPYELCSLLLSKETESVTLPGAVSRSARSNDCLEAADCPWDQKSSLVIPKNLLLALSQLCGLNPKPLHLETSSLHRPYKGKVVFLCPFLWRPELFLLTTSHSLGCFKVDSCLWTRLDLRETLGHIADAIPRHDSLYLLD